MRTILLSFYLFLCCLTNSAIAAPKILVTIKPIHSIASYITEGITEPELLLSGSSSPHTFSLRPSDIDKLDKADVIIWVGKDLETFLVKALNNLDKNQVKLIELINTRGLHKLALRSSKDWENCSHHHHDAEHEHTDEHHQHETVVFDQHIWLSIYNMQKAAVYIKDHLCTIDPANTLVYEKNTLKLIKELDILHAKLSLKFAAVQNKAFLVFHDAFQYIEEDFKLFGAGAIMLNPGQEPSAKRIAELKTLIDEKHIQCVGFEPQFNHEILNPILENNAAKTTMLDPYGATIPQSPQLYFKLLEELSDHLVQCLI